MEIVSIFPFASLLYFVLDDTLAAYRLNAPHLPHDTAPQHTPPPPKIVHTNNHKNRLQ